MYVIEARNQRGRWLHRKKLKKNKREESRNRQHSIDEKILPIPIKLENTILDTPEEESKRRNLIVDNTIHSPVNDISEYPFNWMEHYTLHQILVPQHLGEKQRYLTYRLRRIMQR